MRKNLAFSFLLIASALAVASCSQMAMPSSPSALSAPAPSGVVGRLTTRDGGPTAPAPTPSPGPAAPCTTATPAPAAPVAVDPNAPAPAAPSRVSVRDDPAAPAAPCSTSVVTDIINIVSYFGSGAFNPNPTTATVGDSIVFTNTDTREHHIVLDDGTEVGDVMPGASTAPMTLTTPTASFHCTIHPSMVGTINMPLPVDNSYMPPDDSYYGYY